MIRTVQTGEANCIIACGPKISLLTGKYHTTWRGIELVKAPQDLIILQHLLWDLKPATIFEIGSYAGGSALWMSDVMKMYGYKTHTYSVDIDLSLVRVLAKENDCISFFECDAGKIEDAFPEIMLKVSDHNLIVS